MCSFSSDCSTGERYAKPTTLLKHTAKPLGMELNVLAFKKKNKQNNTTKSDVWNGQKQHVASQTVMFELRSSLISLFLSLVLMLNGDLLMFVFLRLYSLRFEALIPKVS